MTMIVAVAALPEERLTRDRAIGLVLGFVGVLTILSPWHSLGGSSATGQLACLAATACYGLGFTYLRKQIAPRGLPALAVACFQVSLSALVLTPFVGRGEVHLSWRVVLSMLVGRTWHGHGVRVEHECRECLGRDERVERHLPHARRRRRLRCHLPRGAHDVERTDRRRARRTWHRREPKTIEAADVPLS